MEKYIYIDETGIHAATFDEILAQEKKNYRDIYGADIYLDNDSFDGQFIAISAYAKYQTVNAIVSAYNQFSPKTATGERLSSLVKINGIARHVASRSTVDVVLSGTAGTIIYNGIVSDGIYKWKLPDVVVIPFSGEMTITATCQEAGAIHAQAGAINQIVTPTRGWQTVNNPRSADAGSPVEQDYQLRKRQSISTAIPSRSIVKGILGSIQDLPGVSRAALYENDTDKQDKNGLPPHSISVVVEGGDANQIAKTIAIKKGPGCNTHGDVEISVADAYGVPMSVRFFRAVDCQVKYRITLKPLSGFNTIIQDKIVSELVNYTNRLYIGESVVYTRLFVPANLKNSEEGETFEIIDLVVSANNSVFGRADIKIPFNGSALCSVENVEVIIS